MVAGAGNDTTMSCPCLTLEEKIQISGGWIQPAFEDSLTERTGVGSNNTKEEFGVGCAPHSVIGGNSWCYVDPENCELKFADSNIFNSLYYSYAACGYPDGFVASNKNLQGVDLRVVYVHNHRGYKGTICPD